MFAFMGTVISAMVVGGGIYLLGQVRIAYLNSSFSHAHYFWDSYLRWRDTPTLPHLCCDI